MAKEVLLVFQDCYDCGSSKEWYQNQSVKAAELGIIIRPMPHTALGAKGLILKADRRGASKMPFFTDGKNKFGYSISRFADPKPVEKKAAKRSVKSEPAKETN